MVGSATGQAGGLHANWVRDGKCSLLVLNCHLLASSSTKSRMFTKLVKLPSSATHVCAVSLRTHSPSQQVRGECCTPGIGPAPVPARGEAAHQLVSAHQLPDEVKLCQAGARLGEEQLGWCHCPAGPPRIFRTWTSRIIETKQ